MALIDVWFIRSLPIGINVAYSDDAAVIGIEYC